MKRYHLDKKTTKSMTGALRNGSLKYHQFYNTDLDLNEYAFQNFMKQYKEGDYVSKILNKSYYDIEVFYDPTIFPDAELVNYPINAIAVYNTAKNEATVFTVPVGCNIEDQKELEDGVNKRYLKLCQDNPKYLVDDMIIKVKTFTEEADLIKEFFIYMINLETLFLIGFNSSTFDDPYVVNRGLKLVGERIYDYISEFGEVHKFGNRTYTWNDYIKIDILKLYKPVDAGGGGLGKPLPNYKLNTVAKFVLDLTKLDLDDMNQVYLNDIVEFLTYNLLDTILTFKIDEKLEFLELMFSLAKYNTSPMSATTSGRSKMYTTRNNLIYTKNNIIMRSKKYNREVFWKDEPPEDF